LARTIYMRYIYVLVAGEITKYAVIHSVYIRFWPTIHMYSAKL